MHPLRVLPLLALLLVGCDSGGLQPIPDADRTIELHFQSYYTGQRAVAEINGFRVFDGRLTTENVLSLAEIAEVEVAEGEQRLRVSVAGFEATETFTVGEEPVYVGIRFQAPIEDPPVEFIGVRIDVSDERFLYY